jgi:thiosulfate/3-mercaptopyruvate sulfurtransferase
MMNSGGQLMDARSAGRFAGTAPEPRPGLQSGHMPGAVNVPYTELTRGTRMKAPEELRAAFEAKGVRTQQPVTTTCGSGVTAAVLALGLEICGAPHVSLYDGSWAEYAQQPDAVIEGAA